VAAEELPVVFLPFTSACDARTFGALCDFARKGGTVVADLNALRYDEHGRTEECEGPTGLEILFGVRRKGAVRFADSPVKMGDWTVPGYGSEALKVVEGQARGRHADGTPAYVVRQVARAGRSTTTSSARQTTTTRASSSAPSWPARA